MQFLKKFIALSLFAVTSLMVSSSYTQLSVQADATTLVINYYRFGGDYDDWDLWLWPNAPVAGSGSAYDYNGETGFGKILTLPLAGTPLAGSTRIGFISRRGNWVEKDVEVDRFIDLGNPNSSGEVHVYLVQNNPTIYYNLEDADISHKILTASFADEDTISFALTKSITEANMTLKASNTTIPKKGNTWKLNANNTGSFDISVPVILTEKYTLEVDFGDATPATLSVGFDGFYNSELFNEAYGFTGDLGAIYTPTQTTFRLWAPISDAVVLNLYTHGHTAIQQDNQATPGVNTPYQTYALSRYQKGTWQVIISGDLEGVYYTFTVTNGNLSSELVDPYAFSTGINGKRGMIVDFSKTNPTGWQAGSRPETMVHYTDAIIYEMHVRDFTTHTSWNGTEANRGKFLGLTETGTTYKGVKTGLDHILELGVTHVQFIPIFDHGIVDETRLKDPTYKGIHDGIFNWGYMPDNFNALEGSYATDPYNGYNRIEEFKQMVKTFHDHDIRVIMDVVYNHTGKSADSNFDLILPGYYFRMNANGTFSNGSGTGNETASERSMFRKFMVDSLKFYAEEYNLDGFRFDLMKLHDVETMNAVVDALHEIDPTIMIFGEPWTGGTSPLPQSQSAYNATLAQMPGVAVFNDDTRDGIKGSVFEAAEKGFVQGNNFAEARVVLGVAGATAQDNLTFGALPKGAWAPQPTQTINYVTAHDNNTLHDKLYLSTYESIDRIARMQRQANAIILTSQGIPFLHAGVEILRTKPCVPGGNTCDSANMFDHNSYKSPDETNQIDWQWKVDHANTFNYYQSLIKLRKEKSVFRLHTKTLIEDQLFIIPDDEVGFFSFFLYDENDAMKTIYVLQNNGSVARNIPLQPGTWNVLATTDSFAPFQNGSFVPLRQQVGNTTITMQPNDLLIMYATETIEYVPSNPAPQPMDFPWLIIVIASSLLFVGGFAGYIILLKKGKKLV
jgi:pullulanase